MNIFKFYLQDSKKPSLRRIKSPEENFLPIKQLMWVKENELLISTCSAQLKVSYFLLYNL